MKRILVVAIAALGAVGISVLAPAAAERGTAAWLSVPPAANTGFGETLIVFVGGTYATREEADTANGRLVFGDLQGFVVARSDGFTAMKPGSWVLVTAFRTNGGAEEFASLARAAHVEVRRVVTRYTGHQWIGLGQEANPDGSGPLVGPLPVPETLR